MSTFSHPPPPSPMAFHWAQWALAHISPHLCTVVLPLPLQCLSVCYQTFARANKAATRKGLVWHPECTHRVCMRTRTCCCRKQQNVLTSLDTLKRSSSLALFHIKHSTNFETGQGDTDDQGTVWSVYYKLAYHRKWSTQLLSSRGSWLFGLGFKEQTPPVVQLTAFDFAQNASFTSMFYTRFIKRDHQFHCSSR